MLGRLIAAFALSAVIAFGSGTVDLTDEPQRATSLATGSCETGWC